MPAHKGTQPPGGSRKGIPNKTTADIKAMLEIALEKAGGSQYLYEQSVENPKAFMALVAKLIPNQHTGAGGEPLIPTPAETDNQKICLALMAIFNAGKPPH